MEDLSDSVSVTSILVLVSETFATVSLSYFLRLCVRRVRISVLYEALGHTEMDRPHTWG